MLFYRALYQTPADPAPIDTNHRATLAEAHAAAKGWPEPRFVRIELIDVPSDKAGILALLQGYNLDDFAPVRTWALTARGGLREVANGE